MRIFRHPSNKPGHGPIATELPPLAAVLGLPCASRGSALAWLADMASRLEIGQPWTGRLWDAQRALPEADRTASGKLKRKLA